MSVFSLSPSRLANTSNTIQVCSGALEAYLGVGDFVSVDVFGTDRIVGRIVDIARSLEDIPESERESLIEEDSPMFLLRLWPFIDDAGEHNWNADRLSSDDKLATWGLREVMEGDAGLWLAPALVENIAFVCHLTDITIDKYGCLNSIFNIFFVRYSSISGTPVLFPFFTQFCNLTKLHSYSYRIFQTSLYLIEEFGKVFYRRSETQSTCVFIRGVRIFPEYWKYILKQARDCGSILISEKRVRLCKKRWRFNLSQKKIQVRTVVWTLLADTNEAVSCLGSIFGASFFIGIRKQFPRIGDAATHIQTNSNLNVVNCLNEESLNYIKFKYDSSDCQLSIKVSFSHISVNSETNVICTSLPPHLSELIISRGGEDEVLNEDQREYCVD